MKPWSLTDLEAVTPGDTHEKEMSEYVTTTHSFAAS
jgi:hypothetical protein